MYQPGVMIYGYNKKDAFFIKDSIEKILECGITLLSGSYKEADIVENIISDELHDVYEDNELKVLMFLGFDDSQIDRTLEKFPAADMAERPIFCGLTENNIEWPLKKLLEHLIEERNYWNSRSNK